MKLELLSLFTLLLSTLPIMGQNSMVGDGFGGRLWYEPTRYMVGSYSAYYLCTDFESGENQLYGWGNNSSNQLGLGMSVQGSSTPIPIQNMTNVKYYSCGYLMGVIKNDNTGWAWGVPSGIIASVDQAPFQVISDVKFLSAGSRVVSFIKDNGTVWSVGFNFSGHFGDGTSGLIIPTFDPVQMIGINNAVRIACSTSTNCILLADSTLMVVGKYSQYLGLPGVDETLIPLPLTGIPKIVDIEAKFNATIALTANGEVYFWGADGSDVYYEPIKIDALNNIVAISGCEDGRHFLVLDEDKNCYAFGGSSWGEPTWGQLGSSDSAYYSIDSPVLVATDVIDIMAGETFSYIVKSNGTLWASGISINDNESIWLNLSNTPRNSFTELDPSVIFGNLEYCSPPPPPVESTIVFPNVFSPNNDGVNDFFFFNPSGITELSCTILNRWGNVITSFDSVEASWDGKTPNGDECPDGTYFYVVRYKFPNGEIKTHHGYITLLR
jgi:gliding motility-associated-like protein